MARGPKPLHRIDLTPTQHEELRHLAGRTTAPYVEVVRAKILLLAHDHPDWPNTRIAQAVGCSVRMVRKWRARSRDGPTVAEEPRPGAPRLFSLGPARPGRGPGLHAPP